MSEQMTDKQEALYKAKVTAVFKHLRELASKQGVYFSTVMRRVGVTNVYNYENCLSKLGARHIFLMMEKYGIDPNYFFGLSKSMMLKNAKESNDLEDYQKELKSKNMKTSSKNPLEKKDWVSLRKNPDQVKAAEIMSGESFQKTLVSTNNDIFVLFDSDGDVLDWVLVGGNGFK